MPRYIDADVLDEKIDLLYKLPPIMDMVFAHYNHGVGDAQAIIHNLPTADVVEVVRCKDCTWWKSIFSWNGKEHKVCVRESAEPLRESDDYCSFGERREA